MTVFKAEMVVLGFGLVISIIILIFNIIDSVQAKRRNKKFINKYIKPSHFNERV